MVDIVCIVAGGYSVKGDNWDLNMIPGYVIAVNDSALYLPRVDCIVSMDRLWTEARWDWLCGHKYETWIRKAALKKVDWQDKPWLRPFDCDHKSYVFSEEEGTLNGTNSGGCAFNRAYQLSPRETWLFGYDMREGPNGEKHWYPDYSWKSGGGSKPGKLREWSQEYKYIASKCREAGIQVANYSSRSLIEDFERVFCKGKVAQ